MSNVVSNITQLDADETIFFLRELEYIKSQDYDVKYAMLKNREVIPVSFEASDADEFITYNQFEQLGFAKVVTNYANDLPRADVAGRQFTSPVRTLGSSYGYNLQEVRASTKLNRRLVPQKAQSARRAIAQLENRLSYEGDPVTGLQGWFPQISSTVTVTGGWAGVTTPGGDAAIKDLNDLMNEPVNTTLGVEVADTMLMPIDAFTNLTSIPRSDNSDTTILDFFMQNNPFVQDVDWLNELSAANGFLTNGPAGAVDTAIAYRRAPDAFTLEIPSDFESRPVQERGLEFIVQNIERFGGVIIYYPLSQAAADIS